MARTRSDFLTRAPVLSVGGDSDEDDCDGSSPPLSTQSSAEASIGGSCFSDSDMVTGAIAAATGTFSNPHSFETRRLDLLPTSDSKDFQQKTHFEMPE